MRTHRAMALAAASSLLMLSACTGDDGPSTATSAGAQPRDGVEVADPTIVADSRGAATLVVKILNHTGDELSLQDADIEDHDDVVIINKSDGIIAATGETSIGRIDAPYSIRILEDTRPGTRMTVKLTFGRSDEQADKLPPTTFTAPVVARSSTNDDLLGVPADAIKVKDAVVVVVPGQDRAYVGGTVVSKIDDAAHSLPTAVDAQGEPVRYRHQTATGGPYGLSAHAGRSTPFGPPRFRVPDPEQIGDADYFDAADVTVGETITVTIPFQYGDVIARFKVMAG